MNILIIGYGSIAKKHIIALNSLQSDNSYWALRRSKTSIDQGINNIYSYDEIPNNIDFVIISNPTNKHVDTIKKLIPLNIPLFIEKPISHTMKGVEQITSLIKNNNISTYVACVLRFHPCLQFVKKYLATEEYRINEVNVYCGSYLPEWRVNTDYKNIYSAQKDQGGGVHLDLFHEIDYSVWLFGEPKNVNVIKRSKSSIDINAVDYANYNFDYEDYYLNMVLNYYRRTPKRKIEIVFSDKTWEIDLIKGVVIENDEKVIFKSDLFIQDLYKEQLDYFINKIGEKEKMENDFESSSTILKFCLKDE